MMNKDIIYHNPEEIIEKISQKNQNHDLVFFVGSAISYPNLPNVAGIKKNIIKALCGKDLRKYFDMMCPDGSLFKEIKAIRHEEFIELIYRNIGELAIGALDCFKKEEPNPNHFPIHQPWGK